MPIATMRSLIVTGMLRSRTGGMVTSETRGIWKTTLFSSSVSGILRRKTTMLKNANGMSSRGKAIRYMPIGFLHATFQSYPAERFSGPRSPCAQLIKRASHLFLGFEYLAAAVHAGFEVDVVGSAQLTRILILYISRPRERISGTAHSAPRRRYLAFGDGHGSCSWFFGGCEANCFASIAFEAALIVDRPRQSQSREQTARFASLGRFRTERERGLGRASSLVDGGEAAHRRPRLLGAAPARVRQHCS